MFRLNFSHGSHEQHKQRVQFIREVEREAGRPISILLDLQGPKLRVGVFRDGPIQLSEGDRFRLDLAHEPGSQERVQMPHPEIFQAITPGTDLLLDDGKIRLRVEQCGSDFAETVVIAGGKLSERKGVNVPTVVLPISPLTKKDREDLAFGLTLEIDWVALSFVQRPEDLDELRAIVGDRAALVSKLEKPAAIESLLAIIDRSDAVMVARGDLGVEMPAEQVPRIQKQIVRACRDSGKPVIVATQMLESMTSAPVPTRAEASDVATAVYDGADAVMLSAESASGDYPKESVAMMSRIIAEVEADPFYRTAIEASQKDPSATVSGAVVMSLRVTSRLLDLSAIVTYTRSGATTLRAARERPVAPILSLTPDRAVSRRLALAWGVHSVYFDDQINDVPQMVVDACAIAAREGYATGGKYLAIAAGMPFGVVGSTNFIHIAKA